MATRAERPISPTEQGLEEFPKENIFPGDTPDADIRAGTAKPVELEEDLPEFPAENIFSADTPDEVVRGEARAEAPTAEAGATAKPPSEISARTTQEMTPVARERYGRLPVKEKGAFARAREGLAFWKDPVDAAGKYHEKQAGLFSAADERVKALEGEEASTQATIEGKATAIDREKQALKDAKDALKALDLSALGGAKEARKALETARKSAEDAADKAIGRATKERDRAEGRLKDLAEKRGKAEKARVQFERDRNQAEGKLDDAVLRAVNKNSETAQDVQEMVSAVDGRIDANNKRIEALDATIADLEAKVKQFEGTAIQKTFDDLLAKTSAKKEKLQAQNEVLSEKKEPLKDTLTEIDSGNEELVSQLSDKRVGVLLKDEKNWWIVPMLSVDQMKKLDHDQVAAMLGGEDISAGIIKKLDKAGRLDEFTDVVGSRDDLVAEGILEKPKTKGRSKEAKDKGREGSKDMSVEDLKALLAKAGGDLEISLPDDLDAMRLSKEDIVGLAYDQSVGVADKRLQKGALKLLVDLVKSLFGVSLKEAGSMVDKAHGGGKKKFDDVVEEWNKAGVGPELTVPDDLKGRDLSPGGVKLELAKLVSEGKGDIARVAEFLKPEAKAAAGAA